MPARSAPPPHRGAQRNSGAACRAAARPAIAPELPPDHPLEPGTRPTGRVASPSERIAASENAISEIPANAREPASTSSFIAAARRAAQAAAAAPAGDKTARSPAQGLRRRSAKEPSTITSKIRSLLVGASVVVIVLGTFKMAMTLLDSGSPPPMPAMENSSEPPAQRARRQRRQTAPQPAPAAPSMTSPTPIGRQSLNSPVAEHPRQRRVGGDPAGRRGAHGSADIRRAMSPARIPAAPTAPGSRKLGPGPGAADRKTAGRDRRTGAARGGAEGRSHRGL